MTVELDKFLNSEQILTLIVDQDWKKLFSEAEINLKRYVSTLHEILVKSSVTSTDELLLKLDYIPDYFFL